MSTKAKPVKEAAPVTNEVPEMNQEQKTQILLLQRQILALQVNLHNTQKQLEQLSPAMNGLLTKIAEDMNIDPSKWTFDLDNLKILPKV